MAVCISQWRVLSLIYKVDYCVQECCACVHEEYQNDLGVFKSCY